MISSAREWFKRNRTNFAIGAGVLGAGYLVTQYAVGKLTETRQRMSDERIAKENLRRRFEQNQEDCTFTVLAILPTAMENVIDALPVEQTLAELQKQKADRLARSNLAGVALSDSASTLAPSATDEDGRSLLSFQSESFVHASQMVEGSGILNSGSSSTGGDATTTTTFASPLRSKKSKALLWNEMKISSIARAFTLIYTLALLTLLTRIQLNLLGRRNYLASVVTLASPSKPGSKINLENRDDDGYDENAYGNDFEMNRRYLSFSWWLLHKGCKDLVDVVVTAVKEVFGPLNPRDDITLERLSELTVEVRKRVEGATEEQRRDKKWLAYLLPPVEQEDYVLQASGMMQPTDLPSPASPSLRRLMDETSDLIDSPSFTHVLTLLLDAAFSLLIDTKLVTQAFKLPLTSSSTARLHEIVGTDVRTKVASTLAVFCRQAHAIGSGSTNEYLTTMEAVRDLEAFSAVVYSSNFEFEAPDAATTSFPSPSSTNPAATGQARSSVVGSSVAATPAGAGRAVDDVDDLVLVDGDTSLIGESDLEKAWGKAIAKEDGKN